MPEPVRQLLLGAVLVGAEQGLERRVRVLDQEAATRSQGRDHGPQRPLPVGDMDEHEPRVHEVETVPRRFLRADVVHPYLDRRAAGRGYP